MLNHRLIRAAAAIAVAIAATAAPTASADDHWRTQPAPPQDLRSPDARDAAQGRGTSSTVSPAQVRDLRSPDTRDYADGRGPCQRPRGRRRQGAAGRPADRHPASTGRTSGSAPAGCSAPA